MQSKHLRVFVLSSASLLVAATALAHGAGSEVVAAADRQWKDMGIPGVVAAPVSGDMDKGSSRFFLTYPVGLVTPAHHHSTNHYVTVVSGTITLNVNGHDHKLGPGSYFALTDKASHTAKVEGSEPAVMFIEADAPWDVVMEK